jgi:hypothetical protein
MFDSESVLVLADKLAEVEGVPKLMTTKCHGGGGATTGASPGCDDMAEAASIANG